MYVYIAKIYIKLTQLSLIDDLAPKSRALESNTERDVILDFNANKQYDVPSAEFMKTAYQSKLKTASTEKIITADELYEEFWDEKLNDYVYYLKSYQIGDTIIVKDVILDAIYEPVMDRTVFEVETRRGKAYWPFSGNLTDKYHIGDNLQLMFTIVEEYNDGRHQLLTLDYFKLAEAALVDEKVKVNLDDFIYCGRSK